MAGGSRQTPSLRAELVAGAGDRLGHRRLAQLAAQRHHRHPDGVGERVGVLVPCPGASSSSNAHVRARPPSRLHRPSRAIPPITDAAWRQAPASERRAQVIGRSWSQPPAMKEARTPGAPRKTLIAATCCPALTELGYKDRTARHPTRTPAGHCRSDIVSDIETAADNSPAPLSHLVRLQRHGLPKG